MSLDFRDRKRNNNKKNELKRVRNGRNHWIGKDGHCIYCENVHVIIKRRITIPFNPRQSTRALFLWLQYYTGWIAEWVKFAVESAIVNFNFFSQELFFPLFLVFYNNNNKYMYDHVLFWLFWRYNDIVVNATKKHTNSL